MLPWGGTAVTATAQAEAATIDALLRRLSDERFEAFVLHHALDYTVAEIAELTGTAVGTVKDRLVMGRKQLRKILLAEPRFDGRKSR